MTKDDIQRMAREAGISKPWDQEPVKWETLERFANLVAAAEREKAQWDGIHTCNNDCDRPACIAVRKAVIAEREVCAQEADAESSVEGIAQRIAARIRARGKP